MLLAAQPASVLAADLISIGDSCPSSPRSCASSSWNVYNVADGQCQCVQPQNKDAKDAGAIIASDEDESTNVIDEFLAGVALGGRLCDPQLVCSTDSVSVCSVGWGYAWRK